MVLLLLWLKNHKQ